MCNVALEYVLMEGLGEVLIMLRSLFEMLGCKALGRGGKVSFAGALSFYVYSESMRRQKELESVE